MGLTDTAASTVRIAESTDAGRTWATHIRPIPNTANLSVSKVRRHFVPVAFAALLAAAAAACGGGAPRAAPTTIPNAASSPNPSSPAVSGETVPTLTLGNFGEADGPGESVRDAIANAGVEPRLVNGTLLRQVDGKVWLCEALRDVSPPECAAPRLLVQNWLSGDQTFTTDQGAHEANGVRWVEKVQLFGIVRP